MKKRILSAIVCLVLAAGLFGVTPARAAESITDATKYSYTVTPVLAPFSYFLYVKTDNPDPTSFRLVDKVSSFYESDSKSTITEDSGEGWYSSVELDPGTYYVARSQYADVKYENAATWRVKGGYIFQTRDAFSDGGEFTLLQKTETGKSPLHDKFKETSVKVSCPKMTTYIPYLIDKCTNSSASFFENMDAVQKELDRIAIYPRGVYDKNSPNGERPYPLLATSPYPELSFNEHYNMFDRHKSGTLVMSAYPFILDSASFPGTMSAIAKKLDSGCTVESGGVHYLIKVTSGGETKYYGGAGNGGYDPLYSDRIAQNFTFAGGAGDLGTTGSIESYMNVLKGYETVAREDAAQYEDLIRGATFRAKLRETGGTWIRVASEGWFGYGTTFGYVVPLGDTYSVVSDAWVDGRYVNKWESVSLGEKFEDHPEADIVLHDYTYTDKNGVSHTQDVIFDYEKSSDTWTAWYFYSNAYWYSSGWTLPDELRLTRAQVEAMVLDANTDTIPNAGLVYDGTEYPGTPFTLKNVTGIEGPAEFTVMTGRREKLNVTVTPSDAYDRRVDWLGSDQSVAAMIESGGDFYVVGYKAGSTTFTGTTRDGAYTVTIKVTVKEDPCKDGHKWDGGKVTTPASETAEGVKTFTCTQCGTTRTEPIPRISTFRFSDVTDSGAFYYNAVYWAVGHTPQITNGTTPTTFSPKNGCTRAQVVTFLWRAAGCPAPASGKNPFTDVKSGAYYYDAVLWAVEKGVTNGTSETTFSPNAVCTRAQVVTFLWRYKGSPLPSVSKNPFWDVSHGSYYFDAVLWATDKGITNGVSATSFGPSATCTRGHVVTFLFRAV